MSNKLPIVIARNGIVCVIKWKDDISLLHQQLKLPQRFLVTRLWVDEYLVAVSSADIETISKYRIGPYEPCSDKNSFFIPHLLLDDEQKELDNVIETLSTNGIIGGSGIHQKSTKSGVYVNFPYGRFEDCEMVKIFMGY